ncbi:DUF418 domain-containing protein [Glycomyces buryatensis]|uniref:DUF418 domain-containing protein n=1 Tax=Glycomyces buryatensis TaxID=2570927 RepID=A0A4S8QHT1_9ACTN|nr:DUF418 domain-containing protein [Glycomyces buryatensis]THV42535.1 DUF418 domain-containing protein [Glycomyces buryatensis]
MAHTPTLAPQATALTRRSLGPDLGRGFMLLLVALAHAHLYLWGFAPGLRGYDVDGTTGERALAAVQLLSVDGRAMPLFAALFGYGLYQLTARQLSNGVEWAGVRRLARRRSVWLLVFGALHGFLLFPGEILGTYGILGLVFVGFVVRRDRALLRLAAIGVLVHMIPMVALAFEGIGAASAEASAAGTSDYLASIAPRGLVWALLTPFAFVPMVIPMFALGLWAARRRVLDEPERHLPLLRRTAVYGIGLGVAGGTPLVLVQNQLWSASDPVVVVVFLLHAVTGISGGLGAAALIGLIAHRIRDRQGMITRAIAACGQRSLTFYLYQSVVFNLVFAPFAFGLGGRVDEVAASGIALLTWAIGVVIAALMARAGNRGPFEVLLRRLTYR